MSTTTREFHPNLHLSSYKARKQLQSGSQAVVDAGKSFTEFWTPLADQHLLFSNCFMTTRDISNPIPSKRRKFKTSSTEKRAHVFLYGCTPLPAFRKLNPHRYHRKTQAEKQNQRCLISLRRERSCHRPYLCHLDTGHAQWVHPSAHSLFLLQGPATAALHLSG